MATSSFHLLNESTSSVWRVKLYLLGKDGSWQDQGTGDAHCSVSEGVVTIDVENEDGTDVLLKVPIRVDENYERQQDSIIMWREPNVGGDVDCALSFQEVSGCEELWQIVLGVQDAHSRNRGEMAFKDVDGGGGSGAIPWGASPPPADAPPPVPNVTVPNLPDIRYALTSCVGVHARRELAEFLVRKNGEYVRTLLQLMEPLELAKDRDSLYTLTDVLRSIALLSNETLLEVLLEQSNFVLFAGAMEFDPALKGSAKFREYLKSDAASMQYVPGARIKDRRQLDAVNRLFKLRFLRDSLVRAGLEEMGASMIDHQVNVTINDVCGRIFGDTKLLNKIFLAVSSSRSPSAAAPGDSSSRACSSGSGRGSAAGDKLRTVESQESESEGNAASAQSEKSEKTDSAEKAARKSRRQRSPSHDVSYRQAQALRFLRELFALSRQLSFDRRSELYEHFSGQENNTMGRALLDLCVSVLIQPEETAGQSRADIAEVLCCYSLVCPDRVRQYVLHGPAPAQPPSLNKLLVRASSMTGSVTSACGTQDSGSAAGGVLPSVASTTSTCSNDAVLGAIAAQNPGLDQPTVWSASLKQNKQCLLWALIRRMVLDSDVTVIDLLGDALRAIIDPERLHRQDKERFLGHFYDHYIQWILAPFNWDTATRSSGSGNVSTSNADTEGAGSGLEDGLSFSNDNFNASSSLPPASASASASQSSIEKIISIWQRQRGRPAILASFRVLVDVMCTCVSGHSYRMKYYMLRNNTINNVLRLLQFPHRQVQLSAVRFIRTIIATRDEFYFRHIVKLNTLAPVLQVLRDCSKKDCLLTSSVLEVVEYIRKEGLYTLGEYIASTHAECFAHVLHTPVFEGLQRSIQEQKGSGMWRANNTLKPSSTGPRAGTGAAAAAELRMIAAQEDEDCFSTEGVELEPSDESKEEEEMEEEDSLEQQWSENLDSVGANDAKHPSPGVSSDSRRPSGLTYLTLLAYGSDPTSHGHGPLPPTAQREMDLADTGVHSPRSLGSNSPREGAGRGNGNDSPGTPGSNHSRGSGRSLSPILSPGSISPGRSATTSLGTSTSSLKHVGRASLSEVVLQERLAESEAKLPPLRAKYAPDEEEDAFAFNFAKQRPKENSAGDGAGSPKGDEGSTSGSLGEGVSFVMKKKAKLHHMN